MEGGGIDPGIASGSNKDVWDSLLGDFFQANGQPHSEYSILSSTPNAYVPGIVWSGNLSRSNVGGQNKSFKPSSPPLIRVNSS